MPTVDADIPEFDQGERDDKPMPAPKADKLSSSAADTNEPPATAAQETPDEEASFLTGYGVEAGVFARGSGTVACAIVHAFSSGKLYTDIYDLECRSGTRRSHPLKPLETPGDSFIKEVLRLRRHSHDA